MDFFEEGTKIKIAIGMGVVFCVIGLFEPFFIFFGLILFITGGCTAYLKKQREDEESQSTEQYSIVVSKYKEYKNSLNIPNCSKLWVLSANNRFDYGEYYCWKDYNYINLFYSEGNFGKGNTKIDFKNYNESLKSYLKPIVRIPLNDIENYKVEGSFSAQTMVSGGGGGGSSLGGAVIGGIIAGEVGAIIGSRKEINPIKSTIVNNDNRRVILNYFVNSAREQIEFTYKSYPLLLDLLPEKEFKVTETKRINTFAGDNKSGNSIDDITVKIEKLAELKQKGFISDDEFEDKKRDLLNKI